MTKEAIREQLHNAPFVPFEVRVAGGSAYTIPTHDHAALSPNGRLLTIYTDQGNGVKILDVALITEISLATN